MLRSSLRAMRAGAAGTAIGLVVVSAFAFWISKAANAADGSFKDDIEYVELPSRQWAGCYLGISAGHSMDATKARTFPATTVVSGAGSDDIAVGGYVGCNMQDGGFVYGLEADLNGTGDNPDMFGSIRIRLGTTIGQSTLLYLTAGGAFANHDFTVTGGGVTQSFSESVGGMVFGGGIEQMLGSGVALRLEALHYDYAKRTKELPMNAVARVNLEHTVVRAGLSFSFDMLGLTGGGGTDPDVVQ